MKFTNVWQIGLAAVQGIRMTSRKFPRGLYARMSP